VNDNYSETQPGDEDLKHQCFQLSDARYQFVRDHGGSEIGDYLDPDVRRRDDEIMLEYEQSLGVGSTVCLGNYKGGDGGSLKPWNPRSAGGLRNLAFFLMYKTSGESLIPSGMNIRYRASTSPA
jgi:hypothetical protein